MQGAPLELPQPPARQTVRAKCNGRAVEVEVAPGATVETLALDLARAGGVPDAAPSTLKLIRRGGRRVPVDSSVPWESLGLGAQEPLMLVCSSNGAAAAVRAAQEPRAMRGFAEEERREAARRGLAGPSPRGSAGHRFGRLEVLQVRGAGARLDGRGPAEAPPGRAQAMELLERLVADPGVRGVMERHGWRVGRLVEFPPEGQVGVSNACLLGYNRNRGEEIGLRLRTDDWRGFRKYLRIRETLMHELAHMEHDDHGALFKELNSLLLRECAELDWTRSAGRRAGD